MSEPSQTPTPSQSCSNDTESFEEEIEPKLKYLRLMNEVNQLETKIFMNNVPTCISVHPKFICLGSSWGGVHVLDHLGNTVGNINLQSHAVAVNQISIDAKGDFFGSCSDDGKVLIHSVESKENSYEMNVGRNVKTIALEPFYYKASLGRRFIIGDEKLTLYEKTFLGRLRSTVLFDSEGYVRSLAWGENFIAFSSDIGVRVYDINARCSLALIKWEEHPGIAINKFRCNLRWADSRTLLIGWVDTVRVCVISRRSSSELVERDLREYVVTPVSTFKTEFYISGIAPLDHQLVLLGVSKELDDNNKSLRPQLYIVEYTDRDYHDVCTDSLSLRGYENYTVNDYHLDVLIDEKRFFIVAPKDIVIAIPYDIDDRIQWLLQHNKYEEALEVVSQIKSSGASKFTVVSVGIAYIDYLLGKEKYTEAGKLCAKYFGRDKERWEEEIFKFATVRQLRSVTPYIPTSLDCKLDKHIYEMVLYEFLKTDPQGFRKLIKEWDHRLYNTSAVINAVLEQLLISDDNKKVYMEALAMLYTYERCFDKALSTYLTLNNKHVFNLIRTHKLYHEIEKKDKIVLLMQLDEAEAIKLFVEKDGIGAETVIERLNGHPKLLYRFLDEYDKFDTKKQYHGILVKMYAAYDKEKLLKLLQRSDNYPIQEALDICEKAKYTRGTVYLYEKIGSLKKALELIVKELNDVKEATRFCQKQNDPELWDDLISYSLEKEDFIAYLLQCLGTYMDPTMLVQKIKDGQKIPDLKNSLVKMLCTYNLQVSVEDGCKNILVSDYFNLHNKLVKVQQKGILVSNEVCCPSCNQKIYEPDMSNRKNIVVFNCKHVFHALCFSGDVCCVCQSSKQKQEINFQ